MTTLAIEVGGGHAMEQPETMQATTQSHNKTTRSSAVIILERDGSLVRCGPQPHPPDTSTSAYTELPAHLVRQQDNLIDRVIDFAFGTLGLTSLELRVSEQE